MPEHPYWAMIPGLLVAPLLVITGTIAFAIMPDICDLDELATGQRREGLFTSVMAFFSKMEISMAIILSGYLVGWSHVDVKINHRWESVVYGAATNSLVYPQGYQWYSNGVALVGANSSTYYVSLLPQTADGAVYNCEVSVPGGSGRRIQIAPSSPGSQPDPSGCRIWTSYPGIGTVGEPALSGSCSTPTGLAAIAQPVSVCHQWSITGIPSTADAQW